MDFKIRHELENKMGSIYLNLKVTKKILCLEADPLPEEIVVGADNIKKLDKCLKDVLSGINDIKKIIESL